MTGLDVIMKDLADIKGFVQARIDEKAKPLKEETDRLAKALLDIQSRLAVEEKHRMSRLTDGRILVPGGRFAGMDPFDLRLMQVLADGQRDADDESGRLNNLRADIRKERSALMKSLLPDSFLAWGDNVVRRSMQRTMNQDLIARFRADVDQWSRALVGMVTRATLDSTTAGKGDELVPTFEAATMWMDVNLATLVLPLLPQIPMPTNPYDIPVQFGNTNWYPATENVQVTTTALATAKATLTAYGLKTGVPFSDELDEDAIINLVPEIRAQLVLNAAQIIDDVLVNADTATSANINADGAVISTTSAGKAHWLLGFNGIKKLPLVTNTAQRSDKNAAIDTASFNKALGLLAKYAIPQRPGDVVFLCDVRTAIAALNISDLRDFNTFGPRFTLSTGELMSIFGKPLIQSQQLLVADTDGKVTDSGNVTNTGQIIGLNTSQWRVGFRRQITMENFREPGKGQTTMYVSFRIALTERTGTPSTASHTSIVFDITGV